MISKFLASYKNTVERLIVESIEPSFGPPTVLREAIEYALKNGGKRFRPAITYMVANALGKNCDISHAALAIEYFHTASLIADDLPCMDDDDQRREMPSLHKVFGEATALLATYALIAAGYDHIRLGAEKLNRSDIAFLAIENASFNTGIKGATGGQYDDLFPAKPSESSLISMIDKKTGTLFEISFVFGWLFGGGDLQRLKSIKLAARSFGRAFQISDDFLDFQEDREGSNLLNCVGIERTSAILSEELNAYYALIDQLGIASPELLSLGHLVEKRLEKTVYKECLHTSKQPTHLAWAVAQQDE
jgi:geranylgeranyl diphosphate synthase type II